MQNKFLIELFVLKPSTTVSNPILKMNIGRKELVRQVNFYQGLERSFQLSASLESSA
jgi:hypothetical protein